MIRILAQPAMRVVGAISAMVLGLVMSPGCGTPRCGDGKVQSGEACDDGDEIDINGCTNSCTLGVPFCGNAIVDEDEQCDDGDLSETPCNSDCLWFPPVCGDEIVSPIDIPSTAIDEFEECDDGNTDDNDDCTNACKNAVCGDGELFNVGLGTEECDDGNLVDYDDCTTSCLSALCGDGVVRLAGTGAPEQCDESSSTIALPQKGTPRVQLFVHPLMSISSPSSHASPLCTLPSPHLGVPQPGDITRPRTIAEMAPTTRIAG